MATIKSFPSLPLLFTTLLLTYLLHLTPIFLLLSDSTLNNTSTWPSHPSSDPQHLLTLSRTLNFHNNTLLNYFHLHKTGGVSLKSSLLTLFRHPSNLIQLTHTGYPLTLLSTCYRPNQSLSSPIRCDMSQLSQLSPSQKQHVHLIIGHQYWYNGVDHYFRPYHDIQHFSIFRHPFPRRLSFFFHFHVKRYNLIPSQITLSQVINFMLDRHPLDYTHIHFSKYKRKDEAPGYYTARFSSDGRIGFFQRRFGYTTKVVEQVVNKIETRFLFVGLQSQPKATACMVQKSIQVLAHAHGVDRLIGISKLGKRKNCLNQGVYRWNVTQVWEGMTKEERIKYKLLEQADLRIYQAVGVKFMKDVRVFQCDHLVDWEAWQSDTFYV